MLQSAIGQIRANHEMLSRLDAAVGDGGHGEAGTGPSKILTADEAAELMYSRREGIRRHPPVAHHQWQQRNHVDGMDIVLGGCKKHLDTLGIQIAAAHCAECRRQWARGRLPLADATRVSYRHQRAVPNDPEGPSQRQTRCRGIELPDHLDGSQRAAPRNMEGGRRQSERAHSSGALN